MSIELYINKTRLDKCKTADERKKLRNNARSNDGWIVYWRVAGKKKSKVFLKKDGFTRHDAEEFDLKMKREIRSGDIQVSNNRMLFADLCERYLEDLNHLELEDRTVTWIKYHVNTIILNYKPFKKIETNQIKNGDYVRFRNWLTGDRGLSRSTALKVIPTFKNVLRFGRSMGWTQFTPNDDDLPRTRKKSTGVQRAEVPQYEDVEAVIKAAGPRIKPVIVTITESGLRIGECLALQWRHIDFDGGVIQVRQNLDRFSKPKTTLKTDAAWRTIPMSQKLKDMLLAHRVQAENDLTHGLNWFVFPNKKGNNPIDPTNLSDREHVPVLRELGLSDERTKQERNGKKREHKLSFHSYRHYYASVMLHDGLPIHVLAKYMGHADPSITLKIYAHVVDDIEARKAAKDQERRAIRKAGNVIELPKAK